MGKCCPRSPLHLWLDEAMEGADSLSVLRILWWWWGVLAAAAADVRTAAGVSPIVMGVLVIVGGTTASGAAP